WAVGAVRPGGHRPDHRRDRGRAGAAAVRRAAAAGVGGSRPAGVDGADPPPPAGRARPGAVTYGNSAPEREFPSKHRHERGGVDMVAREREREPEAVAPTAGLQPSTQMRASNGDRQLVADALRSALDEG